MLDILTQIPAQYRKYIYLAFAVAGLIVGAIQAGYAVTDLGQPTWLLVMINVLVYVGTALGITAARNVGPRDTPPPAPDTEGLL